MGAVVVRWNGVSHDTEGLATESKKINERRKMLRSELSKRTLRRTQRIIQAEPLAEAVRGQHGWSNPNNA